MKDPVGGYIKNFPKETQKMLIEMRAIIRSVAPAAEEVLSYNMPAYKQDGLLVYFAGHTSHVGLYPMPSAILAFKEELVGYVTAKATVQFPLGKKLPITLIKKIVKFRIAENAQKKALKKKK